EKIDWLGSHLLPVRYCEDDAAAVAQTFTELAGEGADVLIGAGAASLDPLDSIFEGLRLAGGQMVRHGGPAHPGSLLWVARLHGPPVLRMPACGMFSQATAFDLVLPRLLTGEEIRTAELAALGHGGLLSRDSAWRFPPYRQSAARGELPEEPWSTAISSASASAAPAITGVSSARTPPSRTWTRSAAAASASSAA